MDETRLPSREEILLDFDRRLKDRDINPGTSADLTVATLFVCNMKFDLHNRSLDV
jgi:triphosphoribosyl-dephospho-CoA synthase